jgi:hypothetical protein
MRSNSNLREAIDELESQFLYWPAAAARLALGEREKASKLAQAFVDSLTKEAPHPANASLIEKHLNDIRSWCAKHKLEL